MNIYATQVTTMHTNKRDGWLMISLARLDGFSYIIVIGRKQELLQYRISLWNPS